VAQVQAVTVAAAVVSFILVHASLPITVASLLTVEQVEMVPQLALQVVVVEQEVEEDLWPSSRRPPHLSEL
jgi:hypothetical protein